MKRLLIGSIAAGTLALTAAVPALAAQPAPRQIDSLAHDDQACTHEPLANPDLDLPNHSPSCGPIGTGFVSNHNETFVSDV